MYRLIKDAGNEEERNQNPRSYANIFEILTFSWIMKLFKSIRNRDLEEKDLYATLHDHLSSSLGNALEEAWRVEVDSAHKVNRNPSLLKALIKLFGLRYMFHGFALFFNEIILKISQPLFIGGLLDHFSTYDSNTTDIRYAYICTCGLVFSLFTSLLLQQLNHLEIVQCGMKLRVACCSIIYRKALNLNHAAFHKTTVGHVINLLSNDMNRFDTALVYIHYLWIGPLQTIVVAYFLWQEIGVSSIIGISTFIIFIPLQGWFGKKISDLRLKTANMTDKRIHLMNETISGIQLIKMYTWEKPFAKLIEYTRKKEIEYVKSSSYIKTMLSALAIIQTKVQLFIIITSYVLLGNVISIKKVFVVIAFFNLLGFSITTIFCQGSAQVAELLVSIKRIQNFLLLEEKFTVNSINYLPENALNDGEVELNFNNDQYVKYNMSLEKSNKELQKFDVLLSNATAKWTRIHPNNSVENINLTVLPGQLVAIIGPVGAGKSSLLQVILRELPLLEGKITVSGTISYASQEPWLFSGSIQQNIIFDSPMDKERYKQVINVCALKSDIEQLPCGDRTIVGERGVILSGGQRARINLARAVYKKADIYLLDDPLSAVDSKVGNHLFEKCINDFLKHKTCILITHQVQYLANVNKIVAMKDANILFEGSYKDIISTNIDFVSFLKSSEDVIMKNFTEEMNRNNNDPYTNANMNAYGSKESITSSIDLNVNDVTTEPYEEPEFRASGNVSKRVYFSYFSAGGSTFKVLLLFSIYFITRALYIGGDYWISIWVTQEEYYFLSTNNVSISNRTLLTQGPYDTILPSSNIRQVFVVIYTLFIIALTVAAFLSSAIFASISTSSSIYLHNLMFNSIIRATMYFFNTNSSGRILNRFSKDLGVVDEILPSILSDFISFSMDVLGVFIVVVWINFYLTLPTFIIGVIFYFIIISYSKASQIIKRLEGVTRSPILSHMNESLQGLTTIRAYNAEKILINEFDKHQDLHSSAWYLCISLNSAFAFWIDLICLFFISTVIFTFLIIDNKYGGLFGLAITHTMRLLGIVQMGIRRFVLLEYQMTSVERILEYINSPQEVTVQYPPSDNRKNTIPPKEWPHLGEIIFKKINLRYNSNGLYILKNLNFRIQPMEKIGIVGRTGAGKSSIVRALFRLASNEGNIIVDGIDIHELGLQDLRSKFSIIPQEPVLFSGTMRKNLDPFDEHPDYVLWDALSQVELKVSIESLPGGLNSIMSENGFNFSVGQRQLVCLARAIVRNNKILVLDEATANVDSQTDALIQKSIRNVFQKCTVITIAHRLNTVMDSDKILVMDAGRVVEFDHPHNLLKNQNGLLYSMVKETGPYSADTLHIVAAESFKNTRMGQECPIK